MVEFNSSLLLNNNITFQLASVSDVTRIKDLAEQIWPTTFSTILTHEQIHYMLNWMYSEETLTRQIEEGHTFFLILHHSTPVGFMGLQINFPEQSCLKIHKLYVLPELHGQGIGKMGIQKASELALQKECSKIYLNVNRFNKAVDFYKHCGFKIEKQEDIAIGNGFLMEDFVMVLKKPFI